MTPGVQPDFIQGYPLISWTRIDGTFFHQPDLVHAAVVAGGDQGAGDRRIKQSHPSEIQIQRFLDELKQLGRCQKPPSGRAVQPAELAGWEEA